jgi:hypothetical protein
MALIVFHFLASPYVDYQGPREAKPIVDYLLSVQPSNVRFVKGDAADVKSKKSIALDDFLETDVRVRQITEVFCFPGQMTDESSPP